MPEIRKYAIWQSTDNALRHLTHTWDSSRESKIACSFEDSSLLQVVANSLNLQRAIELEIQLASSRIQLVKGLVA